MDAAADLQAQIVALRLSIEGVWLSLLSNDVDPVARARHMREANVAGIRELSSVNTNAAALRDAVIGHTEQLWKSIEWQLEQLRDQ